MNHDALNDSGGGKMVTAWKPWGFHKNCQHRFRGYDGPVLHFMRVLILCGPYPAPNIFGTKSTLMFCDKMPPMIMRVCTRLREQM
jgi:hypothetical protein